MATLRPLALQFPGWLETALFASFPFAGWIELPFPGFPISRFPSLPLICALCVICGSVPICSIPIRFNRR